jgi:hypothetical protein
VTPAAAETPEEIAEQIVADAWVSRDALSEWIAAALRAERERDRWRPIEQFVIPAFNPDRWYQGMSRSFVLIHGKYATVGAYSYTQRGKGRWLDATDRVIQPTHFMPIPPLTPPAQDGGSETHPAETKEEGNG